MALLVLLEANLEPEALTTLWAGVGSCFPTLLLLLTQAGVDGTESRRIPQPLPRTKGLYTLKDAHSRHAYEHPLLKNFGLSFLLSLAHKFLACWES